MRYLPYVLVLFMAAPIVLWVFITNFVVKGTATNFSTGDLVVLGSLGCFVVASFILLPTWMSNFMKKTGA
ncbi:MAG TPA: hypothetical protein VM661_12915 [Candidatus Sulfotelmatobacter sp.]|jgi:hypothetical protein|nr:hypothetical protein [Candidatus Sulfotelmatobacter sp.]